VEWLKVYTLNSNPSIIPKKKRKENFRKNGFQHPTQKY
jgi:hypothetical protein